LATGWLEKRTVIGTFNRVLLQPQEPKDRLRRSSHHVPAEMLYSAAHEVFVGDVLFTVVDVVLDEDPPLRLVCLPGAWRVGAVLVDRALGPCAGIRQAVLDFAQGAEPVDGCGRGSARSEGDSLVVRALDMEP
jgi:hypothetical protein